MGAQSKDPEDFYRAKTASGSSTNALSREPHFASRRRGVTFIYPPPFARRPSGVGRTGTCPRSFLTTAFTPSAIVVQYSCLSRHLSIGLASRGRIWKLAILVAFQSQPCRT